MKRFHVHISVESIEQSTQFYNTLFGQQPAVAKPDYAKWMLDDPRINFAISKRGAVAGLDHLGLQLESAGELHEMTAQFQNAGLAVIDQGETSCCYAKSDKGWVHDPQGIAWESFVTFGESTTYGVESVGAEGSSSAQPSACCAPTAKPKVALSDIAIRPAEGANRCGTPAQADSTAKSCC
jgi:hypothetical protein